MSAEYFESGYVPPVAKLFVYGVPNGIRTRVAAVKGRCPRPLDDGDVRLRMRLICFVALGRPPRRTHLYACVGRPSRASHMSRLRSLTRLVATDNRELT